MNPGHFLNEWFFKAYAYARYYPKYDTTGYKIYVTRLFNASVDDWCLGILTATFPGYEIVVLDQTLDYYIFAKKTMWFNYGIDRTALDWNGWRLQRFQNYTFILDAIRNDVTLKNRL